MTHEKHACSAGRAPFLKAVGLAEDLLKLLQLPLEREILACSLVDQITVNSTANLSPLSLNLFQIISFNLFFFRVKIHLEALQPLLVPSEEEADSLSSHFALERRLMASSSGPTKPRRDKTRCGRPGPMAKAFLNSLNHIQFIIFYITFLLLLLIICYFY